MKNMDHLNSDIYMKVPEGLKMLEAFNSKSQEMYSIKLKRSLYGLKQSGRMWYNRLSEYLIKEGYKSNKISPCVFIKRSISSFVIVAVYVIRSQGASLVALACSVKVTFGHEFALLLQLQLYKLVPSFLFTTLNNMNNIYNLIGY